MSEQNLFDLLGADGEQVQNKEDAGDIPTKAKPPKAASGQPIATDKAKETLEKYNEAAKKDEDKIPLEKVTATGKKGEITTRDVQREINNKRQQIAREKATKAREKARAGQGQKEPDEYPADRKVVYQGHEIPIPDTKKRLEEVRQELQDGPYPWLTKERTDMVYDEESHVIIPVIKGHRKGANPLRRPHYLAHTDVPEDILDAPVTHLLGPDGVYEVRETQAGTFSARVPAKLQTCQGFILKVPKIPTKILQDAIHYMQADPTKECLVNIRWDARRREYYTQRPLQTEAASSVLADGTMDTNEDFTVLQLHSHGMMDAFFSATDDADEIATGFYGVVGNCDRPRPSLALRFSCGGIYVPVNPQDLLEHGYGPTVRTEGTHPG